MNLDEKLQHYLRTWQLSDPELLAQTFTSHVYTVRYQDTITVLKLMSDEAGEQEGAFALEFYGGRRAVRLLRYDDSAHLLEYIPGDSLLSMVSQGHDAQATGIIADVLADLHAVKPSVHLPAPAGLIPLQDYFGALFSHVDEERQHGLTQTDSIFIRAATVAENLLVQPLDTSVLHGDIHHDNIRWHPERGWLVFDPKGLIGESTYDAANTLCNPLDMPALVHNEARLLRNADILAQGLAVERARLLAFTFAYGCLSAVWSGLDEPMAAYTLGVAQLAEPHVPAALLR